MTKENTTEKKAQALPKTLIPNKKRIFTGMKPTGEAHLGNYLGAIKPCINMSQNPDLEVILSCVDWHGLTNRSQLCLPGELTHKIVSLYLALGFNLKNNAIILQSDFPQIQENAWYLACSSAAGLLERSHAYKDALANGKDATGGLLFYPVLMSSDILTFDAQIVPVGKDQLQHLEYARDMAQLFNNAVQTDVFVEPEALVQETPTLTGADGRKMSKSYNNTVPIFATQKEIEKIVKEIKTDSKGLDDPKKPEDCLIFEIFKTFASPDAISHMQERLEKGTSYGYGHAKKDFVDEHIRIFSESGKLFEYYFNNPKEVQNLLSDGYERCFDYASQVVQRSRKSLGLKSYHSPK